MNGRALLRRLFGADAPARHGPPDATALGALPLLLLDTETTGLDPGRDRLLSLAALPWRGDTADGPGLDVLVDPGRPIPAASTAIHGITEQDTAGQPPYARHHHDLDRLMRERVVLGHSIGFDLAVLAAEARRARLHWTRPAALCIGELAACALPEGQAIDLDSLARHFGIVTEGRHSARGDALAVGLIWQRLLPLLGDRGIRHWGEARRAAGAARGLISMRRRRTW